MFMLLAERVRHLVTRLGFQYFGAYIMLRHNGLIHCYNMLRSFEFEHELVYQF